MQALGLLHEEAMKSFARSRAAADFIDAYSKRVKKSWTRVVAPSRPGRSYRGRSARTS
jgi:hypothetical protein